MWPIKSLVMALFFHYFYMTLHLVFPIKVNSHFLPKVYLFVFMCQVVVRALIKTTLPALNVFLVCFMIWLAFSIMGVHLFAGKFYECIDPTSGERFPIFEVMNKSQCESLLFNESMPWENAKLNFDNVGNGFLSLLQVVSSLLIFLINVFICSFILEVDIQDKMWMIPRVGYNIF